MRLVLVLALVLVLVLGSGQTERRAGPWRPSACSEAIATATRME
jgi:hypothetical protein